MHLAQQALRKDTDLRPEKRHDIKENLPVMLTCATCQVQPHFCHWVVLVHLCCQRFNNSFWQVLNVQGYTILDGLLNTTLKQEMTSLCYIFITNKSREINAIW